MKLTAIDKQAVPKTSTRRSPYRDILQKFMESGNEAARIDNMKAKPNSAAAQLKRYIKAGSLPVQVKLVSGSVYLISTGRKKRAAKK